MCLQNCKINCKSNWLCYNALVTTKEFNVRQKMWKKLHNWEDKRPYGPNENSLQQIGELLELYQISKPDWQFWARDFVKGICLLHKKMQFTRGR